MDNYTYYVAFIAPNKDFPARPCETTMGLKSLAHAQRVASQMNAETAGCAGHYEARSKLIEINHCQD